MRRPCLASALVCAVVLMAAQGAQALSVSLSSPRPFALEPGTIASSRVDVRVASPLPYAITIHDGSSRTPGYLDPVDCRTRGLLDGESLRAPLQWVSRSAGRSGTLDAGPALVAAGVPLRRVRIELLQDVQGFTAGPSACFEAPVTVTVT